MSATNYPEFNAAVTELTARVSSLLTDVTASQATTSAQVTEVTLASESATAAANTATTKATEASASATSASTSESTATTAANTATTKATEASASATAANTSATGAAALYGDMASVDQAVIDATTKATEASASATAANTSATGAAALYGDMASVDQAVIDATTKATEASASATAANTSESTAIAAANTATTKATEASASATSASTSESTATTQAGVATTKATEASASATAANTSESTATAAANTATTKATEASASATSASTSESTATAAQVAAEYARDQAVQVAASLTGGLVELGSVNLSGGSYPPIPEYGAFWKVTVGGTVGVDVYGVGDTLVYSVSLAEFYKIDNTESVSSVNGKTGVVALSKSDVGLDSADNTSDVNKPVSAAQATALSAKEPTIAADDVTKFWSGTKVWRDLATDVRASVLTGLSTTTNSVTLATDSVLAAIGKLQAQLSFRVSKTSDTGAARIPAGTTAQRDGTPSTGDQRANTTTSSMEWWNGTLWSPMGGGAKGGGNDDAFYENSQVVTVNYTLTTGKNAMSAGPITINNGVTVTVPDGAVWSVV
jgi:hypothetical protein